MSSMETSFAKYLHLASIRVVRPSLSIIVCNTLAIATIHVIDGKKAAVEAASVHCSPIEHA